MSIQISISIDFYLKDWADDHGEVWACVQPHLVIPRPPGSVATPAAPDAAWLAALDAELTAWLRVDPVSGPVVDDPSQHTYQVIDKSLLPADAWVVPITFPWVTDLGLDLVRTGQSSREFRNPRSRSIVFASEDARHQFKADNHDAVGDLVDETLPNDGLPRPFTRRYNAALVDTWQGLLKEVEPRVEAARRMVNVLTLALWGGAVRRYRADTFSPALNPAFHMDCRVPSRDAGVARVTNLHGLCGLMLRLGTKAEIANLGDVVGIEVVLTSGGNALRVGASTDAQRATQAFFRGLRDAFSVPPLVEIDPHAGLDEHPLGFFWDHSAARRVFVLDNAMGFSLMPGSVQQLYRRRAEREGRGESAFKLSAIEKFIVHLADQQPNGAGPDISALPDTLSWELFDAIEATLVPHRSVTPGGNGHTVLELVPAAAEADKLREFLLSHPSFLASAEGALVGPNGEPLDPALDYLGAFELAWRSPGSRALLYYGKVPASGVQVALLLPRRVTVTTSKVPFDPQLDAFGARWTLDTASLPANRNVEFDVLKCTNPEAELVRRRADLIPALIFRRDVRFALAQSRDSLEGLLTVRYPPYQHPALPTDVHPSREHIEDLINHNALNLYLQYGGTGTTPKHLNPHTELYPTGATEDPATHERRHYFPFRFPQSTVPESSAAPEIAEFLLRLYERTGQPSRLSFDLEHTYGTVLSPQGSGVPIPSVVDMPPALPTQISGNVNDQPLHFLTIDLDETPGAPEQAVLRVRTEWLQTPPHHSEETERRKAALRCVAAWRSIAELAFAEELQITAEFLRFDHRLIVTRPAATKLSDALEPVPGWPTNYARSLTAGGQDVRRLCRRWLESGAPSSVTTELARVRLDDLPGGARIGAVCNVVQFGLAVRRSQRNVPSVLPDHFDLVRIQPSFDVTGQKTQPLDPSGDREILTDQFPKWLESLSAASAPIRPEALAGDAQRLRKWYSQVLAVRRDSADSNDSGDFFIVPKGRVPADPRDLFPIVCPVGLLPLNEDPALRSKTHLLLVRYFRALSLLFDASFGNAWDAAGWRGYFSTLHTQAAPLRGLIEAVVATRVLPMAKPEAGGGLDTSAGQLTQLLRAPGDPVWAVVRQQIGALLVERPALFSDSKAFLYTHLGADLAAHGGGLGRLRDLPFELFAMATKKLIRPAMASTPALMDAHEVNVRNSVSVATQSNRVAGFVEALDDARYDNEFHLQELVLRTFEGAIEDLLRASAGVARPADDLVINRIYVPRGSQQPGASGPPIRLASREPVVAPTHHFTSELVIKAPLTWRGDLSICSDWKLDQLLQGVLEPGTVAPVARVLASKPFDTQPSMQLDDILVSALFAIRGDEEQEQDVIESIKNDSFFVKLETKSQAEDAGAAPAAGATPSPAGPTLGGDVKSLMDALEAQGDVAKLPPDQLLRAVSPDVLTFVTQALRRGRPSGPTVAGLPVIQVERQGAGIHIVGPSDMAINLLRVEADVASPCQPALPIRGGGLLLMLTLKQRVWDRSSVGIIQTRNLDAAERSADFAEEFRQVSPSAGDQRPYQSHGVVHDLAERKEVRLSTRALSVNNLVRKLLLDPVPVDVGSPLPPLLRGSGWERWDLTITVDRRHVAKVEHGFFRRDPHDHVFKYVEEVNAYSATRTPARAPAHFPHSGAPGDLDVELTWFEPPYSEFFVSFQWATPNNSPLFQLDSVPVIIEGA
jgi:hypothetical protein